MNKNQIINFEVSNKLKPIESNINELFSLNKNQRDEFRNYLGSIILSDLTLSEKVSIYELGAAAYQFWVRGVNLNDKEGFVIPYKKTIKNKDTGEIEEVYKATTQIGYKYVERRLWETKEFLEKPIVFELKEDELIGFDPHTRNVQFKQFNIKKYENYLNWKKKKRIGWVLQAKLNNGVIINKFYWQQELENHCNIYSQQWKFRFKNGNKDENNIWNKHEFEMMRKTAFLRMVQFLPNSNNINKIVTDINKVNLAHYQEMKEYAEPIYIDNPTGESKNYQVQKKQISHYEIRMEAWKMPFLKNLKKNDDRELIFKQFKKEHNLEENLKYNDYNLEQIILFNTFIKNQTEDFESWKKRILELEAKEFLNDLQKQNHKDFSEQPFDDFDFEL